MTGAHPYVLYNFAKGHPNMNELPVNELQQIFGRLQESEAIDSLRRALQYGNERGNPELIHELGAFLDRQCAEDAGNDVDYSIATSSFFITEGVSHGIDLLTSAATQPGDLVLTERPTYYLVAGIFHSHGLIVDTMPMRPSYDGIDLDKLEEELHSGLRSTPRMIYIIPANQNPTGRSMSTSDRKRLADLAAKHEILVVADEVYHLLYWGDERRPARMVTWNPRYTTTECHDRNNKLSGCVSVSSFTKIFGPGVRCGWVEGESHIIQALKNIGYIQSQGGVGPVMGSILKTGLEDRTVDCVLTRLRAQYQHRCNLLCDILQSEPAIQLVYRPVGGYFVWLRFPERLGHVDDFLRFCLERCVNFMPGPLCDACPEGASAAHLQSYARLCFAKMDAADVEEGAKVLLESYRSYMVSR
jgi:2-aminoadipate transaminase